MSTKTIQDFSGADMIDVRGIIERVEELREEKQDLIDANEEAQATISDCEHGQAAHADVAEAERTSNALMDWEKDSAEELETLEELLSDLCGYGGDEQWEGNWYPVTLINEDYFEQATDEMVADCYDMPKNLPSFMTITLDYDALKQDYSEVEFCGSTYYYR